jgi:eukaryotic-like serine/threonine-protein kinase
MSDSSASADPLPSLKQQIDPICERFAAALKVEPSQKIEDFLESLAGDNSQQLLKALIFVDMHHRRSRGDDVTPGEYQQRFGSDFAAIEASLFPEVQSTEAPQPAAVKKYDRIPGDDLAARGNRPDQRSSQDHMDESSADSRYFGGYELLNEIGRGGMGVIYKARQTKLDRIVALKMILAGQLASPEDVQRFYMEAEAAASLEHPGIVPVYEIGEHAGQHFFSMGFIEGESLSDQVKAGPLPPLQAAQVTQTVAEAIAYAHKHNIIHRDLKPANILITIEGQPRVTDFGLARKIETDHRLTASGQILGTPAYMPPEQAAGKTGQVGPLSDVYSLGAILYHLLTGRPPFQAATVLDTLIQVLDANVVPPQLLNPAVTGELNAICMKCLEKSPASRYDSADALHADLTAYLFGESVSADLHSPYRMISSLLRETRHADILALHSKAWLWQAPIGFLLFWLINVFIWFDCQNPWVYLGVGLPGAFALMFSGCYYLYRDNRQWTSVERQMASIWWMLFAACGLTTAISQLSHSPVTELIPLLVIHISFAIGAMAVLLRGSLYLLACLCAVSALSMVSYPTIGPAVFGTAFGVGLFVPAWKHSRRNVPQDPELPVRT